jgi:hemoglobin
MTRPSISEAAGGAPAFDALTSRFYEKVGRDPLLSSVFASFTAEHAKNVAIWLGEVFGGAAALVRRTWRGSHVEDGTDPRVHPGIRR